jgi:O-antigen/teichoic acid export membrane protein
MATQEQALDSFGTKHLHADLKGRSVRGGMLTLSAQGTQFFVQSVSTIVLARLLTPADFGLVAMVSAVTGVAQGFADLGLSEATIQCEEINHKQVSALFWINVAIGTTLMLATALASPFLAHFYREPRLTAIGYVVSVTFLVGGLRVQHDALLKRQMRFGSLTIRDITSSLAGVSVAICMALNGAGYWAIVALPLTTNFTQMTLSWVMARWIPGLPERGARVRSLVTFGGNVAGSYMLLNVLRSADQVLIGRYWGAVPLGLYNRAYNLLMLPLRQIHIPVTSVVVPAYSRIQRETERFARYYLSTINLMIWITAPVIGFLLLTADPVIVILLGYRWREAAPIFRILTICALGQVLHGSSIWVLLSRGESARLLKITAVTTVLLIGSYAVGLPFGVKGVALTGSVALLLILPQILKYSFEGTALTVAKAGKAILCPSSVTVAAIVFGILALRFFAPERPISQLLVAALSFAATYSLALVFPAVRKELATIRELVNDLRSRSQSA